MPESVGRAVLTGTGAWDFRVQQEVISIKPLYLIIFIT